MTDQRTVNPARSLIIVCAVAAIGVTLVVIVAGSLNGLWDGFDFWPAIAWLGWLWGIAPLIVALVLARRDQRTFADEPGARSLANAGFFAGLIVLAPVALVMLTLIGMLVSWSINGD